MFQNALDALCNEKWFRLYGNGLLILALFAARYGAGFTWRQVLVGWLAISIWHLGAELLRYEEKSRKFQRVQFRISLTNFDQALIDAGIYSEDELIQGAGAHWDSLGKFSSGFITFTWLERDLFFMNGASLFSESAELSIDLKPFGRRAEDLMNPRPRLPDCLELRGQGHAYELVLIKSESRAGWTEPEGSIVTLIRIPYEFLWSLQSELKRSEHRTAYFERQRGILERAGLKYWRDEDVASAWDFKGKYADLHWWTF